MFDRSRFLVWLIAVTTVSVPIAAHAEVQLAQVFTPHAVLQRDKPLPVWGWAEPGEKIAVTLGARQAEPVADTDGKWLVKLAAQAMSKEPLTLKVVGKNTVEVPDVLLGDVWFCSGQSNMEFSLGGRGGRVWSVSRRPGASLRFNTGPPPHVEEVSIGHALELGMTEAIRRYVAICYPNA